MEQNPNRIAAFIESLPEDAQLGDCQSTLLTTDMALLGAGKNGGDCTNNDKDCFKSKNKGSCHNYSGHCKETNNERDCYTTGDKPTPTNPTPSVGAEKNTCM